MYIRSWVCKIRYLFGIDKRSISNVFKSCFSVIGLIWTLCEIETNIFNSSNLTIAFRENNFLFISGIVGWAYISNIRSLSNSYKINGTDIEISLNIDDFLNSSNAIVIPTCTTFDTLMEDEFISEKSIQGKFQTRYFRNQLKELDLKMETDLSKHWSDDAIEYQGKTVGKNRRYPIGTVAKITADGKHCYFLAVADVNNCGKTIHTKYSNITDSLNGLWNYLSSDGHIENISIPLIGTGRAGIQGVTREKVIKEIIISFIAFNQSKKVTEKLVIYIHPCDLFDKDLDIENIKEFLYYKAKYGYSDTDVIKVGKEVI